MLVVFLYAYIYSYQIEDCPHVIIAVSVSVRGVLNLWITHNKIN